MSEPASGVAFAAVSAAFGSLERACIALDAQFRILHVTSQVDLLLGPGAARRASGQPVDALLGPELFAAGGALRQALAAGERLEGWRALLRGEGGVSRLISVTAAPLRHEPDDACDPDAAYLLVLRPAEDDPDGADGRAPCAAPGLVGRSPAIARILRLVETLQHGDSTVLVTGESGTGKEAMARTLHAHSPRRDGPFVAVNASALPPDRLEGELFGRFRGASTGADSDRAGRLELAARGTLFLNEVGDLPRHVQAKLLRVLEERTYERAGEAVPRETSARVIAATSRDLCRAVAAGTFRQDLHQRLEALVIALPPLRDRREDIEPIASYLLARARSRTGRALRFSPEALRELMSYEWPGNVRELENAVEFASAVCAGPTLRPEDLPPEIGGRPPRPCAAAQRQGTRSGNAAVAPELGAAALRRALEAHRWNRLETARALGVSRSTLWRRMRAAGLA